MISILTFGLVSDDVKLNAKKAGNLFSDSYLLNLNLGSGHKYGTTIELTARAAC